MCPLSYFLVYKFTIFFLAIFLVTKPGYLSKRVFPQSRFCRLHSFCHLASSYVPYIDCFTCRLNQVQIEFLVRIFIRSMYVSIRMHMSVWLSLFFCDVVMENHCLHPLSNQIAKSWYSNYITPS